MPRPRLQLRLLLLLLLSPAASAAPTVVVTISPIHALVAGVMQGVGEPQLLVPPGSSPHSYALLPSEARLLTRADLVVWVGEDLEAFMQKPLRTLADDAAILEVLTVPDLVLESRDEPHLHGAGETGEHGSDPHVWLDPRNAGRIADAVTRQLTQLDPANAATYRRNMAAIQSELAALDKEIAAALEPVREIPFLSFHDAYGYFERRYGLNSAGALTLTPERPPGARRLAEAREQVRTLGVRCIFREPQFEPKLAEAVARGTPARIGVLDPIGAEIPPGPDGYMQLMRQLTTSMVDCLAGSPSDQRPALQRAQ